METFFIEKKWISRVFTSDILGGFRNESSQEAVNHANRETPATCSEKRENGQGVLFSMDDGHFGECHHRSVQHNSHRIWIINYA